MMEAASRPETIDRRATPVTGPKAESTRAAAAPEAEERPVGLARRFFNLKTAASFLLGIAMLIALVRLASIRPEQLWQQLKRVDGWVYLLAVLSYLFTFPFRGLRWQRLLSSVGSRLPLLPLTEVIFISWFVNSVLPGKVGDLYRAYLLRREYGLSLSRTVGTVVGERVVDLLGLILLLGISGSLVLRSRVAPAVDQMLHAGWIGFAVLLVGMVATYRYGGRAVAFLPQHVQEIYERFAHGTFASLSNLPLIAGLTVLCWSAEAGRLYFVMQALGLGVSPLTSLFTVAAISLSLIIPTPGGLGGVEAAFVVVLSVFGVPRDLAFAVALLDRLISYYSLIIFGLPTFLLTKRGRLARGS